MVNSSAKSHKKLIGLILFIITAFTFSVMYLAVYKRQSVKEVKVNGVFLNSTKDIQDFHLVDNKGNDFNKDNLKGHWTMMFFGFTNCGYVCPTTLTELNQMYQKLKMVLPDNQLPQVVMVTVDPERDSVEKIDSYLSAFNSNFIGVRAEMAETISLENQLHISAIKMQAEGQKSHDHYTVNHSAEILLINPDAKVQAYLSFPHKADQLAKDYMLVIKAVKL